MNKLLPLFLLLLFSCAPKQELPPIKVRDLEGKKVRLDSLRGKKTLLYVWSRTCAGHSKDLKRLNLLVQERRDYRIVSYAIAMEPQDVKASYGELKIDPHFMTLVDTPVAFNDHFPIVYLPSTYLFDERGRLIKTFYGLPERF